MQSTNDGDTPPSSAAQPMGALTLQLLPSAFAGRENEHEVKRLLAGMECVLAWQRSTSASNKDRDAMERVATQWQVPRKEQGMKRSPEKIARELETAILRNGQRMLDRSNPFGSVARPASSKQTTSFKRKLEGSPRAD